MTNFYSILYYNAKIWLIPSLSPGLKRHLLAASSSALRLCRERDWTTSFEETNRMNKRATPMQMLKYKHSLELYKLYIGSDQSSEWYDLNKQQNFNARHKFVQIVNNS